MWRLHVANWNVRNMKQTVKHRCSTFLTSADGAKQHADVTLQLCAAVDRTSGPLFLKGCAERSDKPQSTEVFFYVFAKKPHTVVGEESEGRKPLAGNYVPCWTRQAMGSWVDIVWKQRRASHEIYRENLHLARDGVVPFPRVPKVTVFKKVDALSCPNPVVTWRFHVWERNLHNLYFS